MNPALRIVSLFSGCGGADLGSLGKFSYLGKHYSKLNTRIVHASDIDTHAVETYNLNFEHPANVADIHDLNFVENFADIVIGGFPCQSFSTVNPTKDPEDARGQLFHQLVRVIDQIKPMAFIAENVQGFYRLSNGKYFDAAMERFQEVGYRVQHCLINSADFGVPQKRKRIFMVGIRADLDKEYVFPRATHSFNAANGRPWTPLSRVVDSLVPDNPKYYFSDRAVAGVKRAKNNMKRALAQDLSEPCLTITSHLAKVSLNSRDPVLLVDPRKELYRRFTPTEAALIQSFPKSFKFAGTDAHAYRQIGNAICPVVMWHLMKQLSKTLTV
jgi:DNA (cytosine-5)-methyltransferase 1